jgi:ABC-type sugar transport system ATPase subunit
MNCRAANNSARRCARARRRASVLLLDEPFSNLDSDLRTVLRHELAGLQRQLDLTKIFVAHDAF